MRKSFRGPEGRIPKFRRFVIQNFPFIEEDFDALTDYGLLCKVVEYLNKVISSQNEVVTEMTELSEMVEHYFDNLDVQEEINNKLDEMAESGELEEIIAHYVNLKSVLGYDTLQDLETATNLIDGSICKTLGKTSYDDGEGSFYRIRTMTSSDVVDGNSIVALDNFDTLIAEKITPMIEREIAEKCSLTSKYSYDLESYYTILKVPKTVYGFSLIHYYDNYNDGVYKYVDEHPNAFYSNGPLTSPSIIDGEIIQATVPADAEYWYLFGFDESGDVKYTKDTSRTLNAMNLASMGYYNVFGIWCPIIIDGDDFDPEEELPTTDPNYNYIINGNNSKCIFAYDSDYYYIVEIEGRTPRSKGVTFAQAQSFLHTLGVTNAFNMDGGGSTQLWTSNPTTNLIFQDIQQNTNGFSSHRAWELIKIHRKDQND